MKRTRITAHSGSDGTPDNSIEFLQYAASLEIELMEVDVRTNQKGELILAHDEGETDPVRLADAFEFLKAVPHLRMNCDLKISGLEHAVWEQACRHQVQNQLVFSGSVGLADLPKLPWLGSIVGLYLNIEQIIPEWFECVCSGKFNRQSMTSSLVASVPVLKKAVKASHAECLNMNYQMYVPELAVRMKQEGIPVSLWTPDEPETIQSFLKAGVYNITTRSPRMALGLRNQLVEE